MKGGVKGAVVCRVCVWMGARTAAEHAVRILFATSKVQEVVQEVAAHQASHQLMIYNHPPPLMYIPMVGLYEGFVVMFVAICQGCLYGGLRNVELELWWRGLIAERAFGPVRRAGGWQEVRGWSGLAWLGLGQ